MPGRAQQLEELAPDAGDVFVDGVSIVEADEASLRSVRRRVGYVFQNSALFDSLNVGENLRLAMDDALAADRQAWKRAAQDLLLRVNLDAGVADKFPGELSGGMRNRVGVARAIASNPQYVLYGTGPCKRRHHRRPDPSARARVGGDEHCRHA